MGLFSWRLIALRVAGVICAVMLASMATAQDAAQITSYFEALRERGLYGVAERYGLDRRAELPEESAESIQLSVELSRTFAEHAARAATADEQAFLRQRADEVLSDYRGDERLPRIEAVAVERAYRAIDKAELARWMWTADPDDGAARQTAADLLTSARALLEVWIDRAAGSFAGAAGSRTTDDLSRRELAGMVHAARLKSIDLLLQRAELAVNPADRERLVRLAEEAMKKIAGSAERGTTARLKLFAARIARLANDENQLKTLVRQLAGERQSPQLYQDAVAELARLELNQGRFESAASLLVDSKGVAAETSNRLRALHVEAVLGMAKPGTATREQLLASARAEQERVEGPWRLRNEYLLQHAANIDRYGSAAAALVQRGHREFRSGERDAAIATYREAAEAATVPAGQADLRFMAASLLVEAQRFEDALSECARVTAEATTTELAARASLLASYCLGRISAESRSDNDRRRYENSLVEHLRRFPRDETAGDAAWMLGTLAEQEGRPAGVIEADGRMPEGHPRKGESTARAVRATQGALDQLRAGGADAIDGRSAAEWAEDAQRLADRLLSAGGQDLAAARRVLNAAALLSTTPRPDFGKVLSLLDRMPSSNGPDEKGEWQQVQQDAAALRLICLTATGKFADAAATLEQLRSVSTTELLSVLRKLSITGRQLTGPARADLARLELATIQRIRLQRAELSPEDRQLLDECEAEALLVTGRFDEAARMFQAALAGNAELAPRLADALEQTGRPADLAQAREIWKQQLVKQKQGTTGWFAARLRLAKILLAQGQAEECRKLILSTRIAYRDMGGPELKRAFEDLERQAGK